MVMITLYARQQKRHRCIEQSFGLCGRERGWDDLGDWQFVSYMILYMFQCHSPKSSYPLPLPQSPKDCSIHLCLFCCLVYRVIVTIFLNSIYICVSILYWCFSFWLTSLCIIGSSFIHLIRTDSNVFFLMAE